MKWLFWKNKQRIQTVTDSKVNQAGGDLIVNEGVPYSELRQMVLDVVHAEMFQSNQFSRKTMEERALQYDRKIVERLSDEQNTKLIEQFSNPDIQFAMRDSVRQYIRSGTDDSLEEQVDMLIDRLNVANDSIMKSIVEEAIVTLPKLSKPAAALLAAMRFRTLAYNGNSLDLLGAIHTQAKIFRNLDGLELFDIAYLRQLSCCVESQGYKKYNSYGSILVQKYNVLFRHYGPPEVYNNLMIDHPELCLEFDQLSFLVNYKNKCLIPLFPKFDVLKTELAKIGKDILYDVICDYIKTCPEYSDQEAMDFILNESPDWNLAFEILNRDEVQLLDITPLGAYIGQKYYQKMTHANLPEIEESFNSVKL